MQQADYGVVDLGAGRVSVVRSVTVVGGYEMQFTEPKTARGRRSVALDVETVKALKAYQESQMLERALLGDAYEDGDLVFARGDGTPVHPDGFADAFQRQAKAAKLPRSGSTI